MFFLAVRQAALFDLAIERGGLPDNAGGGGKAGGAEGTRTPDIRLAKAALSQLSYGPRPGWASLESNQGPQSYQDCALTD